MSRVGVVAVVLALLVGGCTAASPERPVATPTPTTSSTAPSKPLPKQPLEVTSHPSEAKLTIKTPDGTEITGTTPYHGEVPGGAVEITVSRPGYEPKLRTVTLDGQRQVTAWLDPEGQLLSSVVRFETGSNPKQVAYTPDRSEIWTSLLGPRGVQVFDSETGKLLDEIDLGDRGGAVEVIFNEEGSRAYASQMETASVYEIDTAMREVVREINVKGAWTKVMALSPDERMLYASNWSSNDVSEIDIESWRVTRVIPTVATPRGLYPTPDGKRLYVAGYGNGEIARIDLATGTSTVIYSNGGSMRHIVGDGSTAYVSDMEHAKVYAVDLAAEGVRTLTGTDEKPNTIDLSPDGKVLFVSCRGRNNPRSYYLPGPEWGSVLAVDTASGRLLDAVVAGNQPTGLDVSDDGERLAMSDFLDNRVRVFDIPAYAELAAGGGGRAGKHRADLPK